MSNPKKLFHNVKVSAIGGYLHDGTKVREKVFQARGHVAALADFLDVLPFYTSQYKCVSTDPCKAIDGNIVTSIPKPGTYFEHNHKVWQWLGKAAPASVHDGKHAGAHFGNRFGKDAA